MTDEIRKAYSRASDSAAATQQLEQLIKQQSQQHHPVILAYKAVVEALKAKFVWLPFQKMSHLNTMRNLFYKAVEGEENNIEIRFLRFSIQANLPAILMQSPNLKEDKSVIIENIDSSTLSIPFKEAVVDFLVNSGECTEKEIEILRNKLISK
ncbi:MAG: hypothetical protein AAF734_04565 [Bacteroidota bacterium]